MTQYFLGVDVGGTKSHALVADESGRALGFGKSGCGNPEGVGYEELTRVIAEIVGQAIGRAGISKDQIAGAGFGIAGYDWPSQRESTLRSIRPLGLTGAMDIVNDTVIGLLAGAEEGWGVAVVAGTGCNCRGWDRHRREGRVLGLGPLNGEAAGGEALVRKALQAVSYEWTRRGPATRLTQAFIAHFGAAGIVDLLEGVTTERHTFTAASAPIVFRVAAEGDAVARGVIEWAGRELGGMATGVIRQLGFEALEFDVVLVGSLYNGSPLLVEPMRETIHRVAPGARLVRLTAPPVVGGVLLAMELAGLRPQPLRANLIQSTNELVRELGIDAATVMRAFTPGT